MVVLICTECGSGFKKTIGEFNRRIRQGHEKFYCTISCGAVASNALRKRPILQCQCPRCLSSFTSSTGATYCSRICASVSSVTAKRLAGNRDGGLKSMANLISSAETLKTREAWKYAELKEVLCSKCVAHEFEFRLGSYVYDLCILDKNMLVEFDGSYHSNHKQRESDKVKDKFGTDNGYKIARVKVPTNAVIPGNLLYSMF